MSEQAIDQTDDDDFTYEVCDEHLEAAAGVVERGPTSGCATSLRAGC